MPQFTAEDARAAVASQPLHTLQASFTQTAIKRAVVDVLRDLYNEVAGLLALAVDPGERDGLRSVLDLIEGRLYAAA